MKMLRNLLALILCAALAAGAAMAEEVPTFDDWDDGSVEAYIAQCTGAHQTRFSLTIADPAALEMDLDALKERLCYWFAYKGYAVGVNVDAAEDSLTFDFWVLGYGEDPGNKGTATKAKNLYPFVENEVELAELLREWVREGVSIHCLYAGGAEISAWDIKDWKRFIAYACPGLVSDSYEVMWEALSGDMWQYNALQQDALLVTVRLIYSDATEMLAAWRSGDDSELTDDERSALAMAGEVVAELQSSCTTQLELERAILQYICDHVSYKLESETAQDTWRYDRNRTAAGALLDGEALCEGFSRLFYLLGNMAGLEVDMQSGFSIEGGGHQWNLIRLDGAWYLVDPTWCASQAQDGSGVAGADFVNLGMDLASQLYAWEDYMTVHALAPTSDDRLRW